MKKNKFVKIDENGRKIVGFNVIDYNNKIFTIKSFYAKKYTLERLFHFGKRKHIRMVTADELRDLYLIDKGGVTSARK